MNELVEGVYVQSGDELLVQCGNLDDLRGCSGMLLIL